jgi:hypothetical protein
MTISFSVETPKSNPAGRRLALIAALIFGVLAAGAGGTWLSSGSIVIRGGEVHSGSARNLHPAASPTDAPVAGVIRNNNLLFYPLCLSWLGLGVTMVALALLSLFTSSLVYPRLSAWSCLALLLLAFGTVGAAIWSGT